MLFNARASAGAAALKAIWLIHAVALHLTVVTVASYSKHHDWIVTMVCAPAECDEESRGDLFHGRKYITS